MTADQLNTVLSICVPLVIAWLAALLLPAWKWLMAHEKEIDSTTVGRICMNAAKSVAHTLVQGQLLTPQHLEQAMTEAKKIDPKLDLTAAAPILRAAFHDINTGILQVVAQQQQAASSTPSVVTPTVDYASLAGTLMKLLAQTAPAAPVESKIVTPASMSTSPVVTGS